MTLTGHKWSSTIVRCQNQLQRMPQSTSCSQTVLNGRQTSEPICKNAQIAVSAHKQSSTSDTCQNQLAKCPKSTSYVSSSSQRQTLIRINRQECPNSPSIHKWEGCPYAHRWTYPVLELVSSSQMQVSFPPRKV